jgi:hypothetical protein
MSAITVFHHIPEFLDVTLQLDKTIRASWEQEALTALETSDVDTTKTIIQLVPIVSWDAIKRVLEKRQDRHLDATLAAAEQERRTSPLPVTVPNNPICKDPNVFADGLHSNIVKRVRGICFASWGRYMFGMKEYAIWELLRWASDMSQSLYLRYKHSPKMKRVYEEAEKVFYIIAQGIALTGEQKLGNDHRDLIAHWILASSLGLICGSVECLIEPLVIAIRELYAQ